MGYRIGKINKLPFTDDLTRAIPSLAMFKLPEDKLAYYWVVRYTTGPTRHGIPQQYLFRIDIQHT